MLKKEDISKLKSISIDELFVKRDELKKELMDLRFQKSSGQLTTPHFIKKVRRNIAMVETEITKKGNKNA